MDNVNETAPASLREVGEQKVRPLCQQMLDEFTSMTPGLRQAVIASSDGFPLATVSLDAVESRRLTAMSATLGSLSRRIVSELSLADAEATTIETATGLVFCRQITNNLTPLVLLAVTDGSMNAGFLNRAVKIAATSLTDSLNALAQAGN